MEGLRADVARLPLRVGRARLDRDPRDLNLAARKRFVQRLKTLKVNDCRARQARRRALKVQLPALFRAHGFYRPEIVRHVLSYVGFDLPAAEAAALLCACSSYQDWPYTRAP